MKKLEAIKTASQIIVSVGVGAIVGNAVKITTPGNLGLVKKICVGVGSFVLSNMVSEKAIEYVDEKIDTVAYAFRTSENVQV